MLRLQQGTFSLLPDLTDDQIAKQLDYCRLKNFAIGIEYTEDPHPRNCYWEMWGLPLFDMPSTAAIMAEIDACKEANDDVYIKINAFNNTRGVESTGLSFIIQRPYYERGFMLLRQEGKGRNIVYTMHSNAW